MDRSWIAHGHGGWHADWLVVPRPIYIYVDIYLYIYI